jgi:programmed cell death protein 5
MNGDIYQQMLLQKQLQEELKEIKRVMSIILDKKARERLANVRLVKPELATQLELYLYQLYKAGQIKQITEDQMIKILQELSKKPQGKIKFKFK